ncbi:MAG: RnfABCDGE type electron transport complex subunit B [Planctomycetota bacterium]|jgi:Na+-translocating ferredoxin:NAD+ oxidoreductase RNF subunit RnfB
MILALTLFELWQSSWPAGLIMLGLGGGFALVLLIASIKLKVEVDPKIEQVQDTLPGLDCGACGFAGCSQYAKAVIENPELIGKCAPGAAETADKIAVVLNLQISESGAPKRPIVRCRAHTPDRTYYGNYEGIPSCTAANALANVQACKFGCLGLGDCTRACKFDALHVIDGLATVDYVKCTGCGACARTCPRHLIEMVPFTHEHIMTVACRNREIGKTTRSMCKVGCIGCGLCVKQCDLFSLENNLANIDFAKYSANEQTEAAMNKCPTSVIIYVGKNAPPPPEKKTKPAAAKKESTT